MCMDLKTELHNPRGKTDEMKGEIGILQLGTSTLFSVIDRTSCGNSVTT